MGGEKKIETKRGEQVCIENSVPSHTHRNTLSREGRRVMTGSLVVSVFVYIRSVCSGPEPTTDWI